MTVDNVLENFPNLLSFPVYHFFCAFHRLRHAALDQLADDEWLEQFNCHVFRETALVQHQFRADHDDGPSGIINALTEQVLTETPLLSFQHIGK